jgi:hypothetical protein
MPKPTIGEREVAAAELFLKQHGYSHVARSRADLLTLVTRDDGWPVARFRRLGQRVWRLEMPTHTGRWQSTPMTADLNDLLDLLVSAFGWTLER